MSPSASAKSGPGMEKYPRNNSAASGQFDGSSSSRFKSTSAGSIVGQSATPPVTLANRGNSKLTIEEITAAPAVFVANHNRGTLTVCYEFPL